jgi:Putative restriction endonuclease
MANAAISKRRPATYADLEAVPAHLVAEIIFGNLETHPRPAPRHAVASNALGHELTGPFQKGRGGPGGWIFMVEPELHLGPHVVVPDLAAWRRERMSSMPEKAYIETPPDWVCEVISPSTEAIDKGPKRRIYATYHVPYLWHLNPAAKLLEVFELKDEHWVLFEVFQDNEQVAAPPFSAVPFSLADLWPLDMAPEQAP